jgi:hypothetical protein
MKFQYIKFFIISLIVSSYVFICCKDSQKISPVTVSSKDSVLQDIPEWYRNSTFSARFDNKLNRLLNLNSLKNGFDSLQIRILIDCWNEVTNLIVLEKNQFSWIAKFYFFKIKVLGDGEEGKNFDFEIENLRIEKMSPASGWLNFSKKLLNMNILNLKDATTFDKYSFPNDGNDVSVELATLNKFTIYKYPNFGMNCKIEGPAQLEQAIRLIEQEFNYKRPCENCVDSE